MLTRKQNPKTIYNNKLLSFSLDKKQNQKQKQNKNIKLVWFQVCA